MATEYAIKNQVHVAAKNLLHVYFLRKRKAKKKFDLTDSCMRANRLKHSLQRSHAQAEVLNDRYTPTPKLRRSASVPVFCVKRLHFKAVP